MTTLAPTPSPVRAPRGATLLDRYHDPVLRRWAVEVVSFVVVAFLAVYFVARARELHLSFDFMNDAAGFGVGDQFLTHVTGRDPGWMVYLAGIANTIRVAIFGIAIATTLGVITGVARLSSNWLVSKIALGYVELVRNMPLLVFVVFWYTAVVLRLPPIASTARVFDLAFLSNRALAFPRITGTDLAGAWWIAVLVSVVVAAVVWRVLRRREAQRGGDLHVPYVAGAIVLVTAVVAFVALGAPLGVEVPVVTRYSYRGGLQLSPEFAGVLLGVAVYRGAFVAEVVRGALQAVPRGEREAAAALGLTGWQQLTRVVLPQALRMVVPSMVGQSQVLVKATSVAVAIAYPDMLSIGRTLITNSGEAEGMFIVILASYLTINLLLAGVLTVI
ncbi:MAG: ABC transporter permease subunit, partial [Chloroflexota bacterium]